IAHVVAHVVMIDDPENTLKELIGQERAFQRAIDFAGTRSSAESFFGPNARDRISLWTDPTDTDYPPVRAIPWRSVESEPRTDEALFKGFGEGDVPKELLNRESTKHSEIRTLSLIREKLWEEAHWFAVSFIGFPDNPAPPMLVPVFKSAP